MLSVAAVFLCAAGAARAATPGPATSAYFGQSNTEELIRVAGATTQVLNAYVAAGDQFSVTVKQLGGGAVSGFEADGTPLTCTPAGEECTIGPLTGSAASAGVWQVTIPPATTWSVAVTPAGQTEPEQGRVWASAYNIVQTPSEYETDESNITFKLFDIDEFGNLYEANYKDYNGVESTIAAEGVGPVPVTSKGGNSPCSEASDGSKENEGFTQSCPPEYSEFQADPRGAGLPAYAPKWNPATGSQQQVFVLPPVAQPAVSNVALNRDNANLFSGTITATVGEYTGPALITITDSAGAVLRSFETNVTPGQDSIPFDGLDSGGQPIAASPITIRIDLNQQGKIHFLLADVERFTGGFEVQALTGPNAGTPNADIVYWNDEAITPFGTPDLPGCRPQVNALAGVHSTGGVHGWSADKACAVPPPDGKVSWGDRATIDTYTYANPGVNAQVTVYAPADLTITKSATPTPAIPGSDESYQLTITNKGPGPAIGANLSDPLPSGLSFVAADTGCTFANGTVTCDAGDLASGASRTFNVVARVASSVTACDDSLRNTATVQSQAPDPDPSNNAATACPPVAPKSNLVIEKVASTSAPAPGGEVTYTVSVFNEGPSDATEARVEDPLPAGLSLVSSVPSQGSCSGATCDLGTILDHGSAQILITAKVSDTANGTIINCASVTAKGSSGGRACTPITPPPPSRQPESDLQVVKKVNQGRASPGQILTYSLKVTNKGPDPAAEAKLTDTPSMELKVIKVKPSQGSCAVGDPLTCEFGTIAVGQPVTVKVTAKVLRAGTEKNTASTTTSSRDPNLKNNLDAAQTRIAPAKPRLLLTKTASPQKVHAGGRVTYRLAVKNPTKVAIRDVRVCDSFPAGLAYVSSSPKASAKNGQACWRFKTLAAGASKTIKVLARALPGARGNLTNHANASAKGVKTVRAKRTVHVVPAPPKPTPVTG